jgi:DNA-binding GntR family transcriptional regulator
VGCWRHDPAAPTTGVAERTVHHQLPPRTELSEAALAASLGMAKAPIRHALLALAQEGLHLTPASRAALRVHLRTGEYILS